MCVFRCFFSSRPQKKPRTKWYSQLLPTRWKPGEAFTWITVSVWNPAVPRTAPTNSGRCGNGPKTSSSLRTNFSKVTNLTVSTETCCTSNFEQTVVLLSLQYDFIRPLCSRSHNTIREESFAPWFPSSFGVRERYRSNNTITVLEATRWASQAVYHNSCRTSHAPRWRVSGWVVSFHFGLK